MTEEKEHLVSPAKYVQVLIALMVLLIVTVAMAFINFDNFTRAHHLGAGWNTAFALSIAIIKGLFIFLIFMHVRYATRLTWVFAAAGFIWLLIMLSLTMTDYLTRHVNRSRNSGKAAEYRSSLVENPQSLTLQTHK